MMKKWPCMVRNDTYFNREIGQRSIQYKLYKLPDIVTIFML